MFSKTRIFNLSLNALLLSAQVKEADTDQSTVAKTLRQFYDLSFNGALIDMDLDSTSDSIILVLKESLPNTRWDFVYEFPTRAVHLRRIESIHRRDDEQTFIAKKVSIHLGKPSIFTDQVDACGEFIVNDMDLNSMPENVGETIALRLAINAATLLVGKGAKSLKQTLKEDYVVSKSEAQEQDRNQNLNMQTDEQRSSWVKERLS